MSKMKKISMLVLTLLMAVSSIAYTPVMAAETKTLQEVSDSNVTVESEYEVEILPGESINLEDIVMSVTSTSSTVDQTFTMDSYHRGADRSYSTSHLRFTVTITDVNGNATSNKVGITLRDYNGNSQGWTINADGSTTTKNNISIVANRVYYFTYSNSGTQALKVHMIITPY